MGIEEAGGSTAWDNQPRMGSNRECIDSIKLFEFPANWNLKVELLFGNQFLLNLDLLYLHLLMVRGEEEEEEGDVKLLPTHLFYISTIFHSGGNNKSGCLWMFVLIYKERSQEGRIRGGS